MKSDNLNPRKKTFGKDKVDIVLGRHTIDSLKNKKDLQKIVKAGSIFLFILILVTVLILRDTTHLKNDNLHVNSKKIQSLKISTQTPFAGLDKGPIIKVDVEPKDAYIEDLVYQVGNDNILEVKNNKVLAKSIGGKSFVVLKNEYIESNKLEISAVNTLNKIEILNAPEQMQVGSIHTYNIKYEPEDAYNKHVFLESSNKDVIEVVAQAEKEIDYTKPNALEIMAVKSGDSKITFKDSFGNILAEEIVKVEKSNITNVILDQTNINIGVDQKYLIRPIITGDAPKNLELQWISENPEIATVDNDGIITGKSVGTATIVVKVPNTSISKKVIVNVVNGKIEYNNKIVTQECIIYKSQDDHSKELAKVLPWEKVEVLNEDNGWYKVRKGDILGYIKKTENLKLLDEMPNIITEVAYTPVNNTNIEKAPEVACAYDLLKYQKFNTSTDDIISNLRYSRQGITIKDGVVRGQNPDVVFVGDPYSQDDSVYGSYSLPIQNAVNKIVWNAFDNISGVSETDFLKKLDAKKPILAFIAKGETNITWEVNGKKFNKLDGKKAVVVIGYDKDNIIYNDPQEGQYIFKDKKEFFKMWDTCYNQALTIR